MLELPGRAAEGAELSPAPGSKDCPGLATIETFVALDQLELKIRISSDVERKFQRNFSTNRRTDVMKTGCVRRLAAQAAPPPG